VTPEAESLLRGFQLDAQDIGDLLPGDTKNRISATTSRTVDSIELRTALADFRQARIPIHSCEGRRTVRGMSTAVTKHSWRIR